MRVFWTYLLFFAIASGCSADDSESFEVQSQKYWEQAAEADRQLEISKAQAQHVTEQLSQVDEQIRRSNEQLDRWDSILDRHENVLEAMEKQYKVEK